MPSIQRYIRLKTGLIDNYIALETKLLIGQENIVQPRSQARPSKLFFHGGTKKVDLWLSEDEIAELLTKSELKK